MAESPAPEADFWQDHSLAFLEMAFRTDRQARVEKPDGFGKSTGNCGDTVQFYIRLCDGKIACVNFMVNGCINTNACANTVAELTENRTLEEAWAITPEMVADFLKTLPADHFHCAELAVGAFYRALTDCRRLAQNPWQKSYK